MITPQQRITKKTFLCAVLFMSATVVPLAWGDELKNVMTIYSSILPGAQYTRLSRVETPNAIPGYAIVRQQKEIEFKTGLNKIVLTGIPDYIDPTTLLFKSISHPQNTTLLAQEYRFDLRNNQELLQKYIGHEITAEQNSVTKIDSYTGKLLSVAGGVILEDKNGDLISLNNYSNIHFPKLSPALFTEPTLICDITTEKAGLHKIETSYLTEGVSWWTEYNALFQENKDNGGLLELSAWVNIINKSGTAYHNFDVNLMAGEVNRATSATPMMGAMAFSSKSSGNEARRGFTETPFFEYHLYSLGRKIDLEDGSIKQLELFPKINQIPVEIQYIYAGTEAYPYYGQPNLNRDPGMPSNDQAETVISFKNSKQVGLGIPLPSGRFRINKTDPNNGLLLIGESTIQHTPKEQEIRLKLGAAFDITIERKQTNFSMDEHRHTMEESFELTVKNQKDKNIVLLIRENLYRAANWKISDNSQQYEKKGNHPPKYRLTANHFIYFA